MTLVSILIIAISFILLFHSLFTLLTMTYSWNDPHTLHLRKSPTQFQTPVHSFSLLVPARNEAEVIADTLHAMNSLNYPAELYEVIVLCREDDAKTITAVRDVIPTLQNQLVRLQIVSKSIDNKPKALNIGLKNARNDVVAVFDAEDEPHPDILQIVNTLMIDHQYDVLQSGVQLINYTSKWFSALNVLEYYFWFKSALHFYAQFGVVPLGGNTVFIRQSLLKSVNGWSENILTEDADLGIRLSLQGANIGIVYDEAHTTHEETPTTIAEFIKQRTRWNQGFLQIFFRFEWRQLLGVRRQLFTAYLLIMPLIQALWIFYLPLTIIAMLFLELPVVWAMFSLLPAYVLLIQLVLYNYGLYTFTRGYGYSYSLLLPFHILLTYFPYQILLSIAAFRGVIHLTQGQNTWEKTTHLNSHRESHAS
ncbi:glycosyltransferase [Candidatus Woesebacteria bacterium]|nr:glycosyltransferase [Candidatus Woesebacteria bacterium]MCD8506774.1 glycosyltransferase [Candidatus Woesebacteria bacterium]MCD8527684.1 glycosyltransferase [Candidatus Woesebacteria bacterium]MCD8546348.1 glycosyltransferase [Candidatus Woesebacteria bacterium]